MQWIGENTGGVIDSNSLVGMMYGPVAKDAKIDICCRGYLGCLRSAAAAIRQQPAPPLPAGRALGWPGPSHARPGPVRRASGLLRA
mmetsp:Transcript_87837/g.284349  ORF Transcript_87837/g.284349 Transcript_87837/m.284349 type:complete len:86 (+) Transcript_87837:237-494(+)